MQTEHNVEVRNAPIKESSSSGVTFAVEGSGPRFSVFVDGPWSKAVEFNLRSHDIAVKGNGVNVDFTATPTLTNSGDCLLKVKGEELTEWQVLRMALEDLLFGHL